ncbi:MAG: glutathione S-transferase family protein [Myxococcota bacterium]
MIHLYTAPSPNGRKAQIALEELGLTYQSTQVNVRNGAQHAPAFLRLCPNSKIPVLEDEGTVVWESGAILLYLAEHHDPERRLLAAEHKERWEAIQLTFFQAAGLGPNLGRLSEQLQRTESERNAEMVGTFTAEVDRILGVLDRILEDGRPFLAGRYSIADIMHYPWLQPVLALGAPQIRERPRLVEWLERLAARPAVVEGLRD